MTPKESSEALGQCVQFRGHEYTLTALIKRHTRTMAKEIVWVVNTTTEMIGPYDNYASAYFAALINFGFDGWTITRSK